MDTAEKIRIFLTKLQNLPENKKKIILWTIVVILAAIMGFFWIRGAIDGFTKMAESARSIKFPTINTSNMPKIPSLDILQTTSPSNK